MPGFLERLLRRKPVGSNRDVAAMVAHLPRPAVHVVVQDAPSRSHFGGLPRLPVGVSWPQSKGEPLTFLARLSLADLHVARDIEWLPAAGALLFFYDVADQPWGFDPADRGGWAVLHVADLPEPLPAPREAEAAGDFEALPHQNVCFRPVCVYPSLERASMDAPLLNDIEADVYHRIAESVFGGEPAHQVSGFPCPVQGDHMEVECQLASNGVFCGTPGGYRSEAATRLRAGAADWRLLFQIDHDAALGAMWGDAGTLFFWVEEAQSRAGKFENAWLVLQCG